MRRLALLAVVCAVAGVWNIHRAAAAVLWSGTFQNGTLAQWNEIQEVAPDRLVVVPDPAGGAQKVLQVKVIQGDNPIKASGNRNEVAYDGDKPKEGDERYYRWGVMWPQDFQSADTWQLFTQWHHTGLNGSPPVQFFTWGEQVRLQISQKDVWNVPLQRGVWHDFVMHVKWSSDPSVGFIELYYDGKISLSKTYGATLFSGQGVYIKQGLYRNANVSQEQTLYHTGMTVGMTLDDVWPQGH